MVAQGQEGGPTLIYLQNQNLKNGRKTLYLIATNIRGCVPSVQVAIPEVQLQPPGTSAKMERITGACRCAVGLRGSGSAIVSDIGDVATPYAK